MGLKSPSSYMTQLEVWVTLNLTCASVQWHRCIFPLTPDWHFFNGCECCPVFADHSKPMFL